MCRPPFRQVGLKLLYQISTDDKHKSMFTYTDSLPLIVSLVQVAACVFDLHPHFYTLLPEPLHSTSLYTLNHKPYSLNPKP